MLCTGKCTQQKTPRRPKPYGFRGRGITVQFSVWLSFTTQVANLPSVGSLPVRALGTHVADFVRFRLLTLCLAGNYMFPRVISQNPPASAGVCALAYHSNLFAK